MPYIKDIKGPGKKRKRYNYAPHTRGTDHKRSERQEVYQDIRYRNLRRIKKQKNPVCQICLMNGIYNPAPVEIHHWRSFVGEKDPEIKEILAYSYDNVVSVCRTHHQFLHTSYLKNCFDFQDVEDKQKELKKIGIDIYDIRNYRKEDYQSE